METQAKVANVEDTNDVDNEVEHQVRLTVEKRAGSGGQSSSSSLSLSTASDKPDVILNLEDLRVAFRKSQLMYHAIESSEAPGGDDSVQDEMKKCLGFLQLCEESVRKLHVFSSNEEAEDVNTEDLELLLTHYYSGKLCLKIMPKDPTGQQRLQVVQRGRDFLEAFLDKCHVMNLLDEGDKKVFKGLQGREGKPPALPREVKMERYKQSRAAKQRLEELAARLKLLKGRGEMDEDMEREEQLLTITCAVKNALDEIDSTFQEEDILTHMAKMNLRFSSSSDSTPPPPPAKEIVVTRIDKNLQMTRETLKAQVFRPSWRQPTMSLEEFAEIELQQALERERREKENALENPQVLTMEQVNEQGLEEDEEVVDKATKKDRDWDDWKDDHPKGRGVTKRF